MEEEKHIPGQAEAEVTSEEKPTEEEAPKAPEPEKEKEPEAKPEEKKPEEAPEPQIKKPRSIYDDLKDKKHELKETRTELETATARVAELEALVTTQKEAETPKEKSKAAADIKEYAEKHGLDADSLDELTNVILSRVPKAEIPMTPEEVAEWRQERDRSKRQAEDQAILASAPSVKNQLVIHDDAELQTVMQEVVKLAHTAEFADKEVDYIVWKNREALSKLVSPKKPSFEQGGQQGEATGDDIPELSAKATPLQAQKAIEGRGRTGELEIRRAS